MVAVTRALAIVLVLAACGGEHKSVVAGRSRGTNGVVRVAASGTTIYAASHDALAVIDPSDPANPRELGRLQIPKRVIDVASDGKLAWLTTAYQRTHFEEPPHVEERRLGGARRRVVHERDLPGRRQSRRHRAAAEASVIGAATDERYRVPERISSA